MPRSSNLRPFGKFLFALLSAFILFRAGASITTEKPNPPTPVAATPELVQIPYDIETGKPLNLVVGLPGFTVPSGPIISGYNSTNVYISVEMQGLIDFLEGLQDE